MLTGLLQKHIQRVSMRTLSRTLHLKAVKHGTRSLLKLLKNFPDPQQTQMDLKVGVKLGDSLQC